MIKAYSCGFPATAEKGNVSAEAKMPWRMRCPVLQNVTLNLPRLGYKVKGDEKRLLSMLSDLMEVAAKAHVEKKDFIQKLLSHGDEGPLSVLAIRDGYSVSEDGSCMLPHRHCGTQRTCPDSYGKPVA